MKPACLVCSICNIWYEGVCLDFRRNLLSISVIRSGYAGFARAVQFRQSSPSGPCFENQVQAALNCFNLTSVWADNEMALADDWYSFHPTFSLQEGYMREGRYSVLYPYNDSVEYGSFLLSLRFPQLSRAAGNEEAKAILQILRCSRKTAGEQRTSCTGGRTPTQTALDMELLMGLLQRLLRRQ